MANCNNEKSVTDEVQISPTTSIQIPHTDHSQLYYFLLTQCFFLQGSHFGPAEVVVVVLVVVVAEQHKRVYFGSDVVL